MTRSFDTSTWITKEVLRSAENRLWRATADRQPAEVIYELMTDVAFYLREMGHIDAAADVMGTARTMIPMFGMRTTRGRIQRCRTSVETHGSFIGRIHCATHDVRWEYGSVCPKAGSTRAKPHWWSRPQPYTKPEITEIIRHYREDAL